MPQPLLVPVDHTDDGPTFASDVPPHWSDAARDLWQNTIDSRPDLTGPEIGSLEQACELVTLADRLITVLAAEGDVMTGSMGQRQLSTAYGEIRMARREAASILNRLTPLSPAQSRKVANLRQGKAK